MKQPACACHVIHEKTVRKVKSLLPNSGDFMALAELYKAFSDCTRLKILWALNCQEMCVCDLAALLNMTKSAISHQLKTLRLANLVKYRKQAQIVYYSIADKHVKDIFDQGFAHIHE